MRGERSGPFVLALALLLLAIAPLALALPPSTPRLVIVSIVALPSVFAVGAAGVRRYRRRRAKVAPSPQPSPRAPRAASSDAGRADRAETAPTLSIVMPVHNVAPHLEASLISVLYQDFQDFELIVVDDASTDRSRSILDMFAAADSRLRVIQLTHNTPGGAGIPSNAGIRAARGRYLGFIDSDDILLRDAFSQMIALAEKENAELVIGGFTTFTESEHEVSAAYDLARGAAIPRDTVTSVDRHPELLALSAVPWRKLYRMVFVREFGIAYPEGDFFFEDNALHWAVLAAADRVVLTDTIVCSHRMGRQGQTMATQDYTKSAHLQHLSSALRTIRSTGGERRAVLLNAFVDRVEASRRLIREQSHPGAQALIAKRLADLLDSAVASGASLPRRRLHAFHDYRASYPTPDLTVVVSTLNCAKKIRRTLDSVLASRRRIDILCVDEGSTDATIAVLREYESAHDNLHVFESSRPGGGRARNSAIPLITGRFALFIDPGDTIDSVALDTLLSAVDSQNADLIFFTYSASGGEGSVLRRLRNRDEGLWDDLRNAETPEMRREIAVRMAPDPWNRVIRTSLLHEGEVFFGTLPGVDDLQFHWQSTHMATRIDFSPTELITRSRFAHKRHAAAIERGVPKLAADPRSAVADLVVERDRRESVERLWSRWLTPRADPHATPDRR